MNLSRILLGIVVCLLLTRCSDKEVKTEYDERGKIKSTTEIVNGKKNGEQKFYYPDGKIQSIHHFKNDSTSGIGSYFLQNGVLSKKVTYSNNVKHGPYEFFFRNGNIAESGNYQYGYKRGLIFQYDEVDSGRLINELYALDTEDVDCTYYIKKFDSQGNVISIDKPFEVLLPSDTIMIGSTVHVKFKFINREYDSAIVILGDFDNPNYAYKKKDTIEFVGKEASTNFSFPQIGSQRLRGQWITYRKEQDADSVYEYTSYGLFEENVTVVKPSPYQARL